MNNCYIIDNKVRFCPLENKLERLDKEDEAVFINSPASRCFLMLLSQQGKVVTQQTFMDEVWQKRGVFVAPNTYYQNISILRKALKKAGFDNNIVVTVPRIGLTLARNIDIKVVSAEEKAEDHSADMKVLSESTAYESTYDKIALASEEATVKAMSAKLPSPPQKQKNERAKRTFSFSLPSLNGYTLLKFNAVLLFALLIILIAGKFLQSKAQDYISSNSNEACLVPQIQNKS